MAGQASSLATHGLEARATRDSITDLVQQNSSEDFILQKLKVGRPQDSEDAMSVFERCRKELDHAYLEYWARKLGVTEELNYIMAS